MEYLGPYTTLRERKDGTVRVRFEVRRNRPEGWTPSIPILIDGRDGIAPDQLNAARKAQVIARAEDLYRDLERLRNEEAAKRPIIELPQGKQTWRCLIELRRQHSRWLDLALASQRTYASTHKRILELFEHDEALLPAVVLDSQVDRIVRARVPSKTRRRAIMLELRTLLRKAMREGWRDKELEIEFYGKRDTPEMRPWTVDEFKCLATSAMTQGEPGVARLLFAQWEIGQRLQSVRLFRYGHQYEDGCFFYKCVKTKRTVRIQVVNPTARKILDQDYRHGDLMFPRGVDGAPFSGPGLSKTFAKIRKAVPGLDQTLQLRQLRHTVILELALAGCTIPEIASITSHAMATVHEVLEFYLPRVSELAQNAMEKRERRRQLSVEGLRGELIVEGTRRIFLGDLPKAVVPLRLVGKDKNAA